MANELEKIVALLEEQLRWIKVSSYKDVKAVLDNTLNTDIKKIIYYLSDGINNQDDIVRIGKVGAGSVSNNWNEWEKLGIGELIPVKRGTRFKRSFNPIDFGIIIPKINSTSNKETKSNPTFSKSTKRNKKVRNGYS